MRDELGRIIMNEFLSLKEKSYSYLIDDGSEGKKRNDRKQCHKKKLKFVHYQTVQK